MGSGAVGFVRTISIILRSHGVVMSAKNRKRLNALMQEHGLSSAQIGELLGRHPQHVRAWRCGLHPMPAPMLRLLELELERRVKPAESAESPVAAHS